MDSSRGQYLTQISDLIREMIGLKVRIEKETDQNLRDSLLNSVNHSLEELRRLSADRGAVSFLAKLTGVETGTLGQQDIFLWHQWISEFRVEYETLSKESEAVENKRRFLANCRAIEEEVNKNWTKWVPVATIGVPSTEKYAYSHGIGDETSHLMIEEPHHRRHHRRGPGMSIPGFQPVPSHFVHPDQAMSPFVAGSDNRSVASSVPTLPPGHLGYPAPNVLGRSDGPHGPSHAQATTSASGNRPIDRRILSPDRFQDMLTSMYGPPPGQGISGPPQAAHFPAGVPVSQQGHYPQLSQVPTIPISSTIRPSSTACPRPHRRINLGANILGQQANTDMAVNLPINLARRVSLTIQITRRTSSEARSIATLPQARENMRMNRNRPTCNHE
ncbi:unnamed protein product [Cyclocybe aegerita]|uniref:Uncharacterized protein n=1 Tax=Cyclocybe aegerita TaxID=1973307 RepID=A0A8S0WBP9_CYCAE|nr:unnamed protein product [Cyclocybe aegerita]